MNHQYWIRTHTGQQWDLTEPDPAKVRILDIAHSLSHVCRWGGHTTGFYSVAQHSVIMSKCFDDPYYRMQCLLHDAPEAYLGDVTRPLKRMLGGAYVELEHQHARAIAEAYNLVDLMSLSVKDADNAITNDERRFFFEETEFENQHEVQGEGLLEMYPDKVFPDDFIPFSPSQAKTAFLAHFFSAKKDYNGMPF